MINSVIYFYSFIPKILDLTKKQLLNLIRKSIEVKVLSEEFA
jgi:hypothetical protein